MLSSKSAVGEDEEAAKGAGEDDGRRKAKMDEETKQVGDEGGRKPKHTMLF